MINYNRTNNFGFVNDLNYDSASSEPLLALIGDSFIQALMVPWKETVSGRLAAQIGQSGRVYSFGISGAAMPQYLALAEYVKNNFHPRAMLVSIVNNDFDGSLLEYNSEPGQHFFVKDAAGNLSITRLEFEPDLFVKFVRSSALARYVMMDLSAYQLRKTFRRQRSFADTDKRFDRHHLSNSEQERFHDSEKAVDAFLNLLPEMSGLNPRSILISVDAIRPQIYLDPHAGEHTYFDYMRKYLISQAQNRGYEIIDLQPIFSEHYRQHHQRFEFRHDAHWNSLAHRLLGDAILKSSVYARTFHPN